MKRDADIRENLYANAVFTGGTNISFQSVTKCGADTHRDSHANIMLLGVAKDDLTLSMVLPYTRQGTRRDVRRISTTRKSSSKDSW